MTSLLKDSELCSFYRLSNVNDVQYWSEVVPEADAAIVPTISNAAMPSLDNSNSNNNNNKNEGLQLVMESVSDYKEYTYEQMFTELVERLELETSKQEISLRELVKDCFDEFVMAKGSVDSVYANILSKQQQQSQQQQQVKGRPVQPQAYSSPSSGSGESELSHALLDVNSSVNTTLQYMNGMYSPIIDRRLKVRSLRHSIGTLSKYSYLFNLPTVIQSFIQSGQKSSSLFGNVELQRLELLISDITRGEEQISANEDASLKSVYSQVGDQKMLLVTYLQAALEAICNKSSGGQQFDLGVGSVGERLTCALLQLDRLKDFGQKYLEQVLKSIQAGIDKCHSEYLLDMEQLAEQYFNSSVSHGHQTQLQSITSVKSFVNSQGQSRFASRGYSLTLQWLQSFCDSTNMMVDSYLELCQMYTNGEYLHVDQGSIDKFIIQLCELRTRFIDILKEPFKVIQRDFHWEFVDLIQNRQSFVFMKAFTEHLRQSNVAAYNMIPKALGIVKSQMEQSVQVVRQFITGQQVKSPEQNKKYKMLLQQLETKDKDILQNLTLSAVQYVISSWASPIPHLYSPYVASQSLQQFNQLMHSTVQCLGEIDSILPLKKLSIQTGDDDEDKQSSPQQSCLAAVKEKTLKCFYIFLDGLNLQLDCQFNVAQEHSSCGKKQSDGAGGRQKQIKYTAVALLEDLSTLIKALIPQLFDTLETKFSIITSKELKLIIDASQMLLKTYVQKAVHHLLRPIEQILNSSSLSTGNSHPQQLHKDLNVSNYVNQVLLMIIMLQSDTKMVGSRKAGGGGGEEQPVYCVVIKQVCCNVIKHVYELLCRIDCWTESLCVQAFTDVSALQISIGSSSTLMHGDGQLVFDAIFHVLKVNYSELNRGGDLDKDYQDSINAALKQWKKSCGILLKCLE
ncbi:hypothetical protein MP228_007100 [Amoeboaphelidium protococcarum]|nr:hypothetical protein MP228_007100 [Amoeboaphelidium protococcarum]